MSRPASQSSSRQSTPLIQNRALQMNLGRQIACFSSKPVAFLSAIATLVSFILAVTSIQPRAFCVPGQTSDWCIKCPKYARCTRRSFRCENGTIKNKNVCLPVENFCESDLVNLHELIVQEINKGTIRDRRTLLEFAIGTGEAESAIDVESALLYDDKYYIGDISGHKDVVLVKPQSFDPFFIWPVFLLCFICLLASIEAIVFRRRTKGQRRTN